MAVTTFIRKIMSNPLSDYWSMYSRRAAQEMQKVSFGSEMEAQSGGSSASFRMSDSPEYVSQILSSNPVSFIRRYPEATDEIRKQVGLTPLFNPNTDESNQDVEVQNVGVLDDVKEYLTPSPSGIADYLLSSDNFVKIGLYFAAVVLILGGFIVLALQSKTAKQVVKSGVDIVV